MSRKKKKTVRPSRQPAARRPAPTPAPAAPKLSRAGWYAATAVALLAIAAGAGYLFLRDRTPPPEPAAAAQPAAAEYAGSAACRGCHQREFDAWQGSHHDLAMQVADEKSVLGNFADAKFSSGGVTSTFFRRDGRFFVNTDGPDGKLADFELKYTFGVTPLQQYLIELPGGRLQAFGIAWDSRPKAQGGQRWFHLYAGRKLKAGDPQHWTGIDQNWNYQCADCHSTNLRKNYDAEARRFDTKWSEINVSCEACHGPASNHLAWAKKEGDWQRFTGPGKGLPVALDERRGVSWIMDVTSGNAARSAPRAGVREIETCARCHARRGQFSDEGVHGRPLADAYRPALLDEGLYWSDGQQRDEVYNHGSLLQSRMFAKGVTCSDCHDPHSLMLRQPGDAVCSQCHQPAKYDGPQHTFHAAGSKGAECASCHMPATTYMVVDPRRDHSFRIPRPDLSVRLGVPNACNQCHADRKPAWAAAQVEKWYGHVPVGYQRYAEAFHADATGAAGAAPQLRDVVRNSEQPAIARASALARLASDPSPVTHDLMRQTLNDPDPLVRGATVGALARGDPAVKAQLLARLLADPVRSVRMEAARALAGPAEQRLAPTDREAFASALAEYVAAQRFNAERPEAHSNLGMLHAERGDSAGAEKELQTALALDPSFVPATVNLADLYRALGREADAERTLRGALARAPEDATLHHALGLALARQKRIGDAVVELAKAAELAPGNARYAYVYAVALHSAGKVPQAIAVLEQAHRRSPGDQALVQALAAFERDRGNRAAATRWAEQLVVLAPDNPQARELLEGLRR